jgi:alpha-ketoglutarate-dependent taurine dioxygenase
LDTLLQDGAVVLQGIDSLTDGRYSFHDVAAYLPLKFFGQAANTTAAATELKLLSPSAPVNGVHDELREAGRKGFYLPGSGLEPHTDGYVYGDDLPDFLFLLCEQPSPQGGANVLLDGHSIFNALEAGDADAQELARFLAEIHVDLSEPGESGLMTGRPATGPVVQWFNTLSGRKRLKWRRQINVANTQKLATWPPLDLESPEEVASRRCAELANSSYLSLWRPLPGTRAAGAEEEPRLRAFDALLQHASAEAFADHSFSLSRGEALVVDNYRVLHGRAPYRPSEPQEAGGSELGHERRFWRVWSWTSEGTGLPPDGARSSNPMNEEVFAAAVEAEPRAEL